jgi:predicted transcriptional regulator
MKNSKQLEKHIKGIANHRRIDILLLIARSEGVTLEKISETLSCNFKTISGHTSKLVGAGLVDKTHRGTAIAHKLSPYGKVFVKFLIEVSNL